MSETPVPAPAQQLLGIAAYARHRAALGLPGRSRGAVQKALKAGRISKVGNRIDPVQADADWLRFTDLDYAGRESSAQATRESHEAPIPIGKPAIDVAPVGPVPAVPEPDQQRAAIHKLQQAYKDEQVLEKKLKNQRLELELKVRRGELVEAAQVYQEQLAIARTHQQQLLNFIGPMARQMAFTFSLNENRAHEFVDRQIRDLLSQMSRSFEHAA